ncbi:NADH dehydrogenase [ubiquinone] flavoprotein 3, mitochondrial [Pleurodeles waltl]|uniref:NADH dehydrogenase [ubiquinone] flavoprotein 3, mitochondrial n=1 Tax=Pleurodeles waltl TaxID=8319 RepID=UPI003709A7D5
MAASLLRLGGKILQLDAWSFRAVHPTISLCTKSGRPKKEPTKNVVAAEKKKVVQVDKQTVASPKKSSPSSHPSAAAAGETRVGIKSRVADKGVTQFPLSKTLVEFPLRAPFPAVEGVVGAAVGDAKEKKMEEEKLPSSIGSVSDSYSSSSESDSSASSDSEGEEDAAEVPVKTEVGFPVRGPNQTEIHNVNKGKVPTAMKKKAIHAKPNRTVLPAGLHRDKSPKGDGPTSVSPLSKLDKLQSAISKPTIELRHTKPVTKVNSFSGAPAAAAPVPGPRKIKVVKKGATVVGNLECPPAKGLPLESHEEVLKDDAPVVGTEAIMVKPSLDSSMQSASFSTKESVTSQDCANQREEMVTPPHTEFRSVPGVKFEIVEPRVTPEIAGEILKPRTAPGDKATEIQEASTIPDEATEIQEASTIPDEATEIQEASTIPDKATEIQEASTIPDKATEIQEASTIPDKATEIQEASTIPDKATEIQESSTIPDKAAKVLETQLNSEKATDMLEPSTISQVAETVDSNATPSKGPGEQDPASDAITETGALSTPPGTEAAVGHQEEVFDNSTYRNLQHHSFTPFTFIDIDVELSKFRLPQPTSGRPSPRH